MSAKNLPRLNGRCETDRIRDDAKHRETLRAILVPARAAQVAPSFGLSSESWLMRVRKLVRVGLAERTPDARWQITDAGRAALASDELISYRTLRKNPPPVAQKTTWELLLGAGRPKKVSGRVVQFHIDQEPAEWREQA